MSDWTPTTAHVAQWVPWLTTSVSTPGAQDYVGDFTADTSPDDTIAQSHIADAETAVSARVPSMPTGLKPLATIVVSRFAAWTLAVAYARTDEDRRRADMLKAAYEAAWATFTETADNTGADSLSPLPVAYAPTPVSWGDDLILGASAPFHPRSYLWPE